MLESTKIGAATSSTKRLELHDLPTELLIEIFTNVCFLDLDPLYSPCLPASPHSGPLLLGQICHLWRQIVVHEHHLWACLHIKHTVPKALIKLFSERSEPLLLSFFWDTDKPLVKFDRTHNSWVDAEDFRLWVADITNLKDYFMDELSHRLGNMHFYNAKQHAEAESHEPGKFPRIRDPLATNYGTESLSWRPLPPLPQSCRSQNRFQNGRSLSWYPQSTGLGDCLLTRLGRDLTSLRVKGLFGILYCKLLLASVAATIVEAEFPQMAAGLHRPGWENFHDLNVPVVLPVFERLTIYGASDDATFIFYPTLICPRIRSIRISCLGFTTDSADRLDTFIHYSRCQLSDLVIVDPTIGDNKCRIAAHPVFQKIQNVLFFVGNVSEDRRSELERSGRWDLKGEHPSLWCGWGKGISWIE